jgi:hypothetical protein
LSITDLKSRELYNFHKSSIWEFCPNAIRLVRIKIDVRIFFIMYYLIDCSVVLNILPNGPVVFFSKRYPIQQADFTYYIPLLLVSGHRQ